MPREASSGGPSRRGQMKVRRGDFAGTPGNLDELADMLAGVSMFFVTIQDTGFESTTYMYRFRRAGDS